MNTQNWTPQAQCWYTRGGIGEKQDLGGWTGGVGVKAGQRAQSQEQSNPPHAHCRSEGHRAGRERVGWRVVAAAVSLWLGDGQG